jgi:hypothetical protein
MSAKTGKFLLVIALSFSLLLLFSINSFAYRKTPSGTRAYENEKVEINQVETFITNYGQFGQNLAGTAGCWWPKGSANAYIYGAGIWVAGVKSNGDSVVVNGYNTVGAGDEFIPGPQEHNQDHLNDPQSHPEDRLYVSTNAEDLAEWPLVDSAGNNIILGDQDTWCLFNGHEPSKQCLPDVVTIPITVTRHTFAWTQDLLKNMMFFEYIVENTGTETITDMYVGLGSDLDIGNADDDLVGLDKARSLGFTSSMVQEAGWDAPPPYYIGFRFLQGPIADDTVKVGQVPANPDTVIMPGERIPLTAFKKFTRDIDATDDHERYLVMAGWDFTAEPPVYNPFGDSLDTDPSDKRMAMSAGPFELAPGEADTIIMAMMFSNGETGGLLYLKQEGDAAKQLYDLDWASPGPPSPPPSITALIPGDKQVTVCWDNTVEKTPDNYYPAMQAAGDTIYREYDVEGYIVYKKLGKTGDWEQIAEFDKKNGITLLPDETEGGADEGLQYTYVDSVGVYNGFEYYYAVSAFDYNTSGQPDDTVFISQESGKSEMVVVPRSDFGNDITESSANVSQTGGATNGVTSNATAKGGALVTGGTYEVKWQPIKEGMEELPVYNYNVYTESDSQLLSDIDAFVQVFRPFASASESVLVDTTMGDTTILTTQYDSLYNIDVRGDFVSPMFDGIEYSGDIDVHFGDSTWSLTYTVTTVSDTDTTIVDTTIDSTATVEMMMTADSIEVCSTYTDNAIIDGIKNYWAFRGGVEYEIRWREVGTDTVTAIVYDVTNDVQVPFGEEWGDNWSFGPRTLSNPEVNSQYITSDNLSSRTYFYICGVKYYFNFVGSEAYPMNWPTHPVTGDVWTVYNSGEVVPCAGNIFEIGSDVFTIGKPILENIMVVPNPYIVRNPWEVSSDYAKLRFTNLPAECTIRIYTLAGNLIKTIEHKVEATATSAIQGGSETWDILTDNNQRPASGIYIYHISTLEGDETKTGKFALIR